MPAPTSSRPSAYVTSKNTMTMTKPKPLANLLAGAIPTRSRRNQATASSANSAPFSIADIAPTLSTLGEVIARGIRPDRPDEPGSFPPICPSWQWRPGFTPQYRAIAAWILAIPVPGLPGPFIPDRGLWLAGSPGTGKTTLLRGLKHLCAAFSSPRSPRLPMAMRWIHAKDISSLYQQSGPAALDLLTSIPCLVIDDIGTEDAAARHYGNFSNPVGDILSRRYDRGLVTLASTNLSMPQVVDRYRIRMADRIREAFNILEFIGPSERRAFNPSVSLNPREQP